MYRNLIFIFISLFLMSGCASSQKKSQPPKESLNEVQSAVQSVADSLTSQGAHAKYCPVCGRRYGANVKRCSVDGALLKEVDK